jgi:uncharacterized Zn finger protein
MSDEEQKPIENAAYAYLDITNLQIKVKCPKCQTENDFKLYYKNKQKLPRLIPCISCGITISVTKIMFKRRRKIRRKFIPGFSSIRESGNKSDNSEIT